MEELRRLGSDVECTSEEMVTTLKHLPISNLQELRYNLFEEAKTALLVHQNDVIVQRQKRAIGPCLEVKLATDIATLAYHLRNRKFLPRTLLRNGKRSKRMYEQSRCQPSRKRTVVQVSESDRDYSDNSCVQVDKESLERAAVQTNVISGISENSENTMAMVNKNIIYNPQQASVFNCHNRNSTAHPDECCEQGDEEHNVSTAGIAATQSSLTNICTLQKSPVCSGVIHSVHDACITDGSSSTERYTPPCVCDNRQGDEQQNKQQTPSYNADEENTCTLSERASNVNVDSNILQLQETSSTPAYSIVKEIAHLREELGGLQREVEDLKKSSPLPSQGTCHLYVRLNRCPPQKVNKALLSKILQSPVLWFSILKKSNLITCKVKIAISHLHIALTAGHGHDDITVYLWHSSPKPRTHTISSELAPANQLSSRSLCVTTWNARGLKSGEPYLNYLSQSTSDIIVVTEHWLWPFEAQRLAKVNKDFAAEIVIDRRLNENSSLKQGCGGVGVLWKKSLDAVPISGIESDRIVGVTLKLSSSQPSCLTVLGVYLLCADQGLQVFCEHLIELERLVTEAQQCGLVVVLGDFNAHLGHLGGPRGIGRSPNSQGLLLSEWADRCHLYAVSMSALSKGPTYTYFTAERQTTVDYIFVDSETAQYLDNCYTHDMHGLNTSDHLPISTNLSLQPTESTEKGNTQLPVNWEQAVSTGVLQSYQDSIRGAIADIIGRAYATVEDLDDEIRHVSLLIKDAAQVLPKSKRPKKAKKWYRDATLFRLSKEKKAAWDTWKREGRPNCGPVYDQKVKTRDEVRRRIRICGANEERRKIQSIDQKFRTRHKARFQNTSIRRTGRKIRVNGDIISDPATVLCAWKEHFEGLGQSRKDGDCVVSAADQRTNALLSQSYNSDEHILDIPFQSEEIEHALNKLKLKKSPDHGGITAEHLKYGGHHLKLWLLQILNAMSLFQMF